MSNHRTRIEVLVDQALARRISTAADAAGIQGYVFLPVSHGKADGVSWSDDQISGGVTGKTLFLTVTSEAKAQALIASLRPLLDSHGLMLFLGQVEVIRGDKYA